MEVVVREQLEAKFGVYLEINDDNILNIKNMPWLDIGELPNSYSPNKQEAFQVFMTPVSKTPKQLIVEFSDWSDNYPASVLTEAFPHYDFQAQGVTLNDLLDTLYKCNILINPYRGQFTKKERIKNLSMVGAGILVFSIAILIGVLVENYVYTVFITLLYLCLIFVISYGIRHMSS